MNEVLYMDEGRVTIPKECRKRHGLEDGSPLLLSETKSGALVLKPVKPKPELSLIEHLKRFKGVRTFRRFRRPGGGVVALCRPVGGRVR